MNEILLLACCLIPLILLILIMRQNPYRHFYHAMDDAINKTTRR